MIMKPFQFFHGFTKGQRKGILALIGLILITQVIYFVILSIDFKSVNRQTEEEKQWLALQVKADSTNAIANSRKDTIYPFNPNYLSDYKGYVLGLSTSQIDRLHAYRQSGKFVNSVADFQKVTGIHDSLALKLSPYIKFSGYKFEKPAEQQYVENKNLQQEPLSVKVLDINAATEDDLVKVYGIGPSYARMILRRRADLGAFVSMEQMDDFTELPSEARSKVKESFMVGDMSKLNKLNVNTASLQQLSRFAYFNKGIARAVITQRSMNGTITRIDELLKIPDFPVDKVKIIALYLEF